MTQEQKKTMHQSLVHRNDIDKCIREMIDQQKQIVNELEKIVHAVTLPSIKNGLALKLKKTMEIIKALEAGYLPVDAGWFTAVDTKSKWNKKMVAETLKTMPEEIREAWEKAEALGVFKGFAVSHRGGDPMIVGKAGQKAFLIGAWVNFQGGVSCGFRFMPRTG